jgi:hypothetical protein
MCDLIDILRIPTEKTADLGATVANPEHLKLGGGEGSCIYRIPHWSRSSTTDGI